MTDAISPSAPPPRPVAAHAPAAPDQSPADAAGEDGTGLWQDGAFSFADLLDLVNPLQHIPVVNKIYREITGDEIGTAARIGGGALFGGVIGLAASLLDTALEDATGKDAVETVVAVLRSGEMDAGPEAQGTDVAEILGYAGHAEIAQESGPAGDADRVPVEAAAPPPVAPVRRTARRLAQERAPYTIAAAAPQPLRTTVPLRGVRGLAAPSLPGPHLPSPPLPTPQALAADPALLAQMRSLGPQMMTVANGARPTGSQGLATATIARALAGYGAAGALVAPERR